MRLPVVSHLVRFSVLCVPNTRNLPRWGRIVQSRVVASRSELKALHLIAVCGG